MDRKIIFGSGLIFFGFVIIFNAAGEFIRIMNDFETGKYEPRSFGIGIGLVALMLLGSYLVKKGNQQFKN